MEIKEESVEIKEIPVETKVDTVETKVEFRVVIRVSLQIYIISNKIGKRQLTAVYILTIRRK